MWLPLKYGFQMICKHSLSDSDSFSIYKSYITTFFFAFLFFLETEQWGDFSVFVVTRMWSWTLKEYCMCNLLCSFTNDGSSSLAFEELQDFRGALYFRTQPWKCVWLCLCVCVSETEGGLLSCRTIVPHPEFEIRSSSPGGPKSKPSFFTCPLTLLIALIS